MEGYLNPIGGFGANSYTYPNQAPPPTLPFEPQFQNPYPPHPTQTFPYPCSQEPCYNPYPQHYPTQPQFAPQNHCQMPDAQYDHDSFFQPNLPPPQYPFHQESFPLPQNPYGWNEDTYWHENTQCAPYDQSPCYEEPHFSYHPNPPSPSQPTHHQDSPPPFGDSYSVEEKLSWLVNCMRGTVGQDGNVEDFPMKPNEEENQVWEPQEPPPYEPQQPLEYPIIPYQEDFQGGTPPLPMPQPLWCAICEGSHQPDDCPFLAPNFQQNQAQEPYYQMHQEELQPVDQEPEDKIATLFELLMEVQSKMDRLEFPSPGEGQAVENPEKMGEELGEKEGSNELNGETIGEDENMEGEHLREELEKEKMCEGDEGGMEEEKEKNEKKSEEEGGGEKGVPSFEEKREEKEEGGSYFLDVGPKQCYEDMDPHLSLKVFLNPRHRSAYYEEKVDGEKGLVSIQMYIDPSSIRSSRAQRR